MDLGQILKDTTDQSNYNRWQGSLFALKDLSLHINNICKDKNNKPTQIPTKIMEHILAECKRYDELMLTTDMGKKMKDLENIK